MEQQQLFDPEDGFIVTAAEDWSHFDNETFLRFYQPLLGSQAFSTFYGLRAFLKPQPVLSDRQLQSLLLAQLNLGRQDITDSLNRLEGVGMVRTFTKQDTLGRLQVYELQSTMTPAELINDDLLSVLLLESVGEHEFDRLVKLARQFQLGGQDTLTETSHRFLDVFNIDQRSVTTPPDQLVKARQELTVQQQKPLVAIDSDFDWPTLVQLLTNQPITKDDLNHHRELIEVEHQLYGIDEPTMARFLIQTINLTDNRIDGQKLKKLIAQSYQTAGFAEVGAQAATSVVQDSGTLSTDEQQLVAACKYYAPVEFLQQLKQQTGGYVTSKDRFVLQGLIEEGHLAKEVVNVLSWYVLISLDNATLPKGLVDTIANNWMKAGVQNASQALQQIQTFNRNSRQRTAGQRRSRQTTPKRLVKEKMPEWTRETAKQTEKSSARDIAKLRERIAKYNQRKGDAQS